MIEANQAVVNGEAAKILGQIRESVDKIALIALNVMPGINRPEEGAEAILGITLGGWISRVVAKHSLEWDPAQVEIATKLGRVAGGITSIGWQAKEIIFK
jgi:hypothetical protein